MLAHQVAVGAWNSQDFLEEAESINTCGKHLAKNLPVLHLNSGTKAFARSDLNSGVLFPDDERWR